MGEAQGRIAQISVLVRPTLKAKIKAAANREGRTVSNWMELAALERLKAEAPGKKMAGS